MLAVSHIFPQVFLETMRCRWCEHRFEINPNGQTFPVPRCPSGASTIGFRSCASIPNLLDVDSAIFESSLFFSHCAIGTRSTVRSQYLDCRFGKIKEMARCLTSMQRFRTVMTGTTIFAPLKESLLLRSAATYTSLDARASLLLIRGCRRTAVRHHQTPFPLKPMYEHKQGLQDGRVDGSEDTRYLDTCHCLKLDKICIARVLSTCKLLR